MDKLVAVIVNMDKARLIHMASIRRARDAALSALDSDHFKAIESGDARALAKIVAQKQLLRDIPQRISLVTDNDTPSELASIWPLGLR